MKWLRFIHVGLSEVCTTLGIVSIHFGNMSWGEGSGAQCWQDGIAFPTMLLTCLFPQGGGRKGYEREKLLCTNPFQERAAHSSQALPSEKSQAFGISNFEWGYSAYLIPILACLASWRGTQSKNQQLNHNQISSSLKKNFFCKRLEINSSSLSSNPITIRHHHSERHRNEQGGGGGLLPSGLYL